jgi:hypothetical protein
MEIFNVLTKYFRVVIGCGIILLLLAAVGVPLVQTVHLTTTAAIVVYLALQSNTEPTSALQSNTEPTSPDQIDQININGYVKRQLKQQEQQIRRLKVEIDAK